MASRILTYGPKEDVLEDPEEGTVTPIYVYFAEALGNDGRWHIASMNSSPTSFAEMQENCRRGIAVVLENRMKEQGVWDE